MNVMPTSLLPPSYEIDLKSRKPKRLMGLKVNHNGFKLVNSLGLVPMSRTAFSNSDENFSIMGLYRDVPT
jgi:hypothetical protein